MSNLNNPFENGKNNNNNPFESNNGYVNTTSSNESNNEQSQTISSTPESIDPNQKKSNVGCAFFIIVIILAGLVYGGSIVYDYFFYTDTAIKDIKSLEVVENYKYDFNDFDSRLEVNPFPETIPAGKDYTFAQDNERAVTSDGNKTLKMIVGLDVDPGIYTIKAEEHISMMINSAVDTYFGYKKNSEYFNIPLVEGDEIEITFFDNENSSPGKVYFTSQSEYVNFEPGINGVFVYGLNQFESEVVFEKESYDSIVYGFNSASDSDWYRNYFVYDEKVKLPGSPGSYFAVEYDEVDE